MTATFFNVKQLNLYYWNKVLVSSTPRNVYAW